MWHRPLYSGHLSGSKQGTIVIFVLRSGYWYDRNVYLLGILRCEKCHLLYHKTLLEPFNDCKIRSILMVLFLWNIGVPNSYIIKTSPNLYIAFSRLLPYIFFSNLHTHTYIYNVYVYIWLRSVSTVSSWEARDKWVGDIVWYKNLVPYIAPVWKYFNATTWNMNCYSIIV